jgi:hypothetical protein
METNFRTLFTETHHYELDAINIQNNPVRNLWPYFYWQLRYETAIYA